MSGPFNMPPFPEGAMNFRQFDMGPHEKAKIVGMFSLLMEDIKNHEEGHVAPDTIGADYFFIQNFVTRDMEWDFLSCALFGKMKYITLRTIGDI